MSAWANATGETFSSLTSFTSPTANTSSRPSARSVRSTLTCPAAFSQSPCPASRSQSVLGVVPLAQNERSASMRLPRPSRYVPKSGPGETNESSRTYGRGLRRLCEATTDDTSHPLPRLVT